MFSEQALEIMQLVLIVLVASPLAVCLQIDIIPLNLIILAFFDIKKVGAMEVGAIELTRLIS